MPIIGFKRTGRPRGGSIEGGGFYGAYTTQSIEGGGSFGAYTSQSIEGGGSVSGVPMNWATNDDTPLSTRLGFFVKVAAFPSADTTLVDMSAGINGYLRVKMTNAGHIIAEASSTGSIVAGLRTTSVDMIAAGVATGVWYWVTCIMGTDSAFGDPHNCYGLRGQVVGPGGATDGVGSSIGHLFGGVSGGFTAILGWGVSQSSAYLNFPNSVGNRRSKLQIQVLSANNNVAGVASVPTSDVSTSGLEALYLCRDAVGTTSGILDSTSNHFDITPGPNGLLVVTDGPYA